MLTIFFLYTVKETQIYETSFYKASEICILTKLLSISRNNHMIFVLLSLLLNTNFQSFRIPKKISNLHIFISTVKTCIYYMQLLLQQQKNFQASQFPRKKLVNLQVSFIVWCLFTHIEIYSISLHLFFSKIYSNNMNSQALIIYIYWFDL